MASTSYRCIKPPSARVCPTLNPLSQAVHVTLIMDSLQERQSFHLNKITRSNISYTYKTFIEDSSFFKAFCENPGMKNRHFHSNNQSPRSGNTSLTKH